MIPMFRSNLQNSYCRLFSSTANHRNIVCLPGSTDKYNGMHVQLTDLSTDIDEEHFKKLLQGMIFSLCSCGMVL